MEIVLFAIKGLQYPPYKYVRIEKVLIGMKVGGGGGVNAIKWRRTL